PGPHGGSPRPRGDRCFQLVQRLHALRFVVGASRGHGTDGTGPAGGGCGLEADRRQAGRRTSSSPMLGPILLRSAVAVSEPVGPVGMPARSATSTTTVLSPRFDRASARSVMLVGAETVVSFGIVNNP